MNNPGASVADWLRSLFSNHLPLTSVGSNPDRNFDSFMWGSYPACLRNVGGSTQIPVRAWNNARKDTWGLPPTVKLERCDMTYIVLMWRKTQNKQNEISPSVSLRLFDAFVGSIINYACLVWGLTKSKDIERLHLK
jgi:hypothetical protein